jgi:signal transduction histidine kinase/ActR/RegA family two-component response regulator
MTISKADLAAKASEDLAQASQGMTLLVYPAFFGLLTRSADLWVTHPVQVQQGMAAVVISSLLRYVAARVVRTTAYSPSREAMLVVAVVFSGSVWSAILALMCSYSSTDQANLIFFCAQICSSAMAALTLVHHRGAVVSFVFQSMLGSVVSVYWLTQAHQFEFLAITILIHLHIFRLCIFRNQLYSKSLQDRLEVLTAQETLRTLLEREGAQRSLLESRHKELTESRRLAEQASQAKGEFLATMSHEIRTPMNAIFGFSEMLLETELNRQQRDWTETIRGSCNALLSVINDILDFSKIESGQLELHLRAIDIRVTLQEAITLVSKSAELKGVQLSHTLTELVPAYIESDAGRLRQILLNLLSNAVKFTRQGSVRVEVDRQGDLMTFSIRDTGSGIPPDKMHRLFKSFSQVDGSTTRGHGGTGLGLVISQRLAEKLGGQIWAESHGAFAGNPPQGLKASHTGPGSSFSFTIQAKEAVAPNSDAAAVTSDLSRLQGVSVLIVEDNPVNQKVLSQMLKRFGVEVTAASGGREALALLEKQLYPLIFMDIQMPEMDGYTATSALRKIPNGETAWVTAITANAFQEDREACLVHGMNDYLSKPVRQNELVAALNNYLNRGTSSTP